MNSKLLVAGVLIIPLVFLAFSGCLGDDDGGYSQAEIRYTIKMANATSEERYILLPIPRLREESASKLTDGLRVTGGSGSFEIVDDTYGKCIKITFTDEIVVHFSGRLNDSSDLDFYYFTMVSGYEEDSISRVTNDENNFYAYVSELNTNETISVDIYGWSHYYWEHGPECGATTQTLEISGELDNKGWSPALSGQLYQEEGA